ncbi:MAG: cytochrome C [Acidobacteriota bacterium]
MKTVLKVVAVIALLAVVVGGALVAWLALRSPRMRPASTEKVEATPERIARGRYVAENVCDCHGCHSGHVLDRFGMPLEPGHELEGGYPFGRKDGIPGLVCAQNLTPDPDNGIGKWTDGEVIRGFREGVTPDGTALFPFMPYPYYRSMSDEDAVAVVAYLRTFKPIAKPVPKRQLDFPVNLLIKFAPAPSDGPRSTPDDATDHLAYGKYLVTIAGCRECHTAHDDHGNLVPGRDFAGGWKMEGPWGVNVTANITPDPDAYMGQATKEEFIGRFKAFAVQRSAETAPVAEKGKNTVMPWLPYSGMTEPDLGAIYDYLKTVPPVKNKVDSFPGVTAS